MQFYDFIKGIFGIFIVAGMILFLVYAALMFKCRIKRDSENAKKKATVALISIIVAGIGMFGSFVTAYFQYY